MIFGVPKLDGGRPVDSNASLRKEYAKTLREIAIQILPNELLAMDVDTLSEKISQQLWNKGIKREAGHVRLFLEQKANEGFVRNVFERKKRK